MQPTQNRTDKILMEPVRETRLEAFQRELRAYEAYEEEVRKAKRAKAKRQKLARRINRR